jgi:hypothetical protein
VFAKPAADAVLGPYRHDLVLVIKFQDFFGTKFHADTAAFAPIPVNMVLL